MGLIHGIWKQAKGRGRIRYNYTWQKPAIEAYIRHSSDKKNAKYTKNRGVLADVQKAYISLSINGLNQKKGNSESEGKRLPSLCYHTCPNSGKHDE